jgi:hypothetical protein
MWKKNWVRFERHNGAVVLIFSFVYKGFKNLELGSFRKKKVFNHGWTQINTDFERKGKRKRRAKRFFDAKPRKKYSCPGGSLIRLGRLGLPWRRLEFSGRFGGEF